MSLLEQYEPQYANCIAETTALIAKLHSSSERRDMCAKIDGNLAEAQELLEQIGLEIRELNPAQRPSFTSKLNIAQVELKRLQNEYRSSKEKLTLTARHQTAIELGTTSGQNAADLSDYYDDASIDNDQRQRLLDNSERIERTGNRLTEGYRVALETEMLGAQVLTDLHHQHETMQSARQRLRETNADLGRASRTLNSMMLRALREKTVLYAVGVCFVVAVGVSLYLTFSSSPASA